MATGQDSSHRRTRSALGTALHHDASSSADRSIQTIIAFETPEPIGAIQGDAATLCGKPLQPGACHGFITP
jgi:hypothetical protein